MKLQTENIYQVIELAAAPAKVFEALLDQDAHVAFTGKEAFIQPHEGGSFSLCNQKVSNISTTNFTRESPDISITNSLM